jgi:hypothetical protein
MNPEYISILQTVAFILDRVGTWPVATLFFFAVIGPWVVAFILSRGQEKRFDSVKKMYENNVKLVEDYREMANGYQDLVIHNIQVMTEVQKTADNNLFCPIVRKRTQQKEVDEQ